MSNFLLRKNVLTAFGANDSEIEELLAYNQNVFDQSKTLMQTFPLPSEVFVDRWRQYITQAEIEGTHTVLKERLVQFKFPIQAGISQTEIYRAATRKGEKIKEKDSALSAGLELSAPEKLQLQLHPTLAGEIPVITAGNREDFITLVQALTHRNEPHPIPDSMGACIVSGYNNWDRIYRYRQQWLTRRRKGSKADWAAEFKRLIPHKELYQDRFIILSPGAYSNVSASDLGLEQTQWQQLSLQIRLEHECTHYITRRLFGSMRNNIFDELIADYRGIVAATGQYRADWFLRFIGLESFPRYREGGRLENYRGDPPLSDSAFLILQALVKAAAENLEACDRQSLKQPKTLSEQASTLMTLTTLSLEELAKKF
jgi:hypothetical protein